MCLALHHVLHLDGPAGYIEFMYCLDSYRQRWEKDIHVQGEYFDQCI